jgi:hypothetical protein
MGFWRNSLSGRAFETKIDSNPIESPRPRTASFKQLYRTRPARRPEPTCLLGMGRVRYSTSVYGQPVNSDRLRDTSAFTGTDSRKTFRPPTTSFLKAYSSTVAIDGGFQYGPTSHDPTRALGGVDGVGAFGGTGTRVNGCPSLSDVSNSAF